MWGKNDLNLRTLLMLHYQWGLGWGLNAADCLILYVLNILQIANCLAMGRLPTHGGHGCCLVVEPHGKNMKKHV
jgi:hypothetical protein